jgi:hypothetical protein
MIIINIIYAGAGYVAGAFTPSVGRAIKKLFVKETAAVKSDVKTEAAKVEAGAKVEVKKL